MMRRNFVMFLIAVMMTVVVSGCQAATLEEIKARGVLRVGFDLYEPFAFEEEGQYEGLEIDLARAIAEAMGVRLDLARNDWDTITKAWKPGYDWSDFDMALAVITIKEERASVCLFSDWYFMTGQMILVRADSPIQKPDQLKSHRVGVMEGTLCQAVAREYSDQVVSFPAETQGYEALRNGEIDAFINDGGMLLYLAKKDSAFRVLDQKLTRERYGIAMPQGTEKLAEAVNEVVRKQRKPLFQKWFN